MPSDLSQPAWCLKPSRQAPTRPSPVASPSAPLRSARYYASVSALLPVFDRRSSFLFFLSFFLLLRFFRGAFIHGTLSASRPSVFAFISFVARLKRGLCLSLTLCPGAYYWANKQADNTLFGLDPFLLPPSLEDGWFPLDSSFFSFI
jgi:hypothetical protein